MKRIKCLTTQSQDGMKEDNPDTDEDVPTMSAAEFVDKATSLDTAIDNFTALLSRIEHNHGPWKSLNHDDDDDDGKRYSNHDLRGRFNVKDDFVKNHLFSQVNDHLAVHEMGKREGEFRGNEAQIFQDIDADTSQKKVDARWDDIRAFSGLADGTTENAPTPPEAKSRLDKVLELRDESGSDTLQEVPDRVKKVGTLTS